MLPLSPTQTLDAQGNVVYVFGSEYPSSPTNAAASTKVLNLQAQKEFAGLFLGENEIRKVVSQFENGWGTNATGRLETFARTFGLGAEPILKGGSLGQDGINLNADEVGIIAQLIKNGSAEGTVTDSLFIVGNQGVEQFNDFVGDLIGHYDISKAFQASNIANGVEYGEVLSGANIFDAAIKQSRDANTSSLTSIAEANYSDLWDSGNLDPIKWLGTTGLWLGGQFADAFSTIRDGQAPFSDRVLAGFSLATEALPLLKFSKLSKLKTAFRSSDKVPNSGSKPFSSLDDFNRAANNPLPNTSYSYGNYSWKTDNLARVSRIEGQATLKKHQRYVTPGEPGTVAIGKDGGFEDVGFHFVGDQFDGPINKLNVVPGSGRSITLANGEVLKNLNLSRYKTDFENPVANIYREAGKPVPIGIDAIYKRNNTSLRPDGFRASYQLPDGAWESVMFKNKAGG